MGFALLTVTGLSARPANLKPRPLDVLTPQGFPGQLEAETMTSPRGAEDYVVCASPDGGGEGVCGAGVMCDRPDEQVTEAKLRMRGDELYTLVQDRCQTYRIGQRESRGCRAQPGAVEPRTATEKPPRRAEAQPQAR